MDAYAWAHQHFYGVHLPDERLKWRLVETAASIRQNPCGTLPRAFAEPAALKGAYRLFAHATVTHDRVLQAHLDLTHATCREPGAYLMLEDTTDLSFSHRGKVTGMGPLTDATSQGFLAHTCLAVRIERWDDALPEVMPIGLFGQECWARKIPEGTRKQRKKAKRQQKNTGAYHPESERWGRSLFTAPSPPPDAQWTLVADRESDIYGLMAQCAQRGLGYILRAMHPRKVLSEEQDVFAAASQAPVLGRFSLSLRSRPGVSARKAVLDVRMVCVTVRPPRENPKGFAPLPVHLVEVCEANVPEGVKPVHWLLLTNWPCADFEHAMRVVQGYACRWLIEEYHKAVKTGTHLEDSQLSTFDRVAALFAIHAVVAVELLRMKLLARTRPDEPVREDEFAPELFEVLEAYFGRPAAGWTYDTLIRMIARLGGYLNRKHDGPPGWLSIWRGWQKLTVMAEGYTIALQHKRYG
jgi:hypothetical protein